MSIAKALGYSEKKIFKQIPEERIKHIGKIFADNEEDRKVLEEVHGLR